MRLDWVVSFFRRVLALYENLPEEGGRSGKTGGKTEGAMDRNGCLVLKLIRSIDRGRSQSSNLSTGHRQQQPQRLVIHPRPQPRLRLLHDKRTIELRPLYRQYDQQHGPCSA